MGPGEVLGVEVVGLVSSEGNVRRSVSGHGIGIVKGNDLGRDNGVIV